MSKFLQEKHEKSCRTVNKTCYIVDMLKTKQHKQQPNKDNNMKQQNNKQESMMMQDVLHIGSEYYQVFGEFFEKKLVKVANSRYIIITTDGVTLRSIEDWNEYKKDIPEFFTIESLAQLHK